MGVRRVKLCLGFGQMPSQARPKERGSRDIPPAFEPISARSNENKKQKQKHPPFKTKTNESKMAGRQKQDNLHHSEVGNLRHGNLAGRFSTEREKAGNFRQGKRRKKRRKNRRKKQKAQKTKNDYPGAGNGLGVRSQPVSKLTYKSEDHLLSLMKLP